MAPDLRLRAEESRTQAAAEHAVRESQERFNTSIQTLIDPFVLLRPLRDQAGGIVDFVYEYANDAACETNALVHEELIGMRVLERFTQLAPAGLFNAYATLVETGEPLALDDFADVDSGGAAAGQRHFDVRALRTGDLLVLTSRDVTERDRAENERARLAAIVRASGDAVISLDADLRIASWNSGAEVIYGYRADEILGECSDLLIPLDATLESRGLRERMVAGGEVQRYETQRLHKDGTLIDVTITAFAMLDGAGKACGATTVTRDISRRRRAERALAESDERYREITETAVANDEAVAAAFVHELAELGCEIALDDFGMGYGGFAYLKRLPVTVLKIDMEFVRDLVGNPENQHVVKAIVTLAHGFGRKTIAEGVETEDTLALLEEYGVDFAQGYEIGRPAPIDMNTSGAPAST